MQKGQRIWKDCEKCKGTGSLWSNPDYAYLISSPTETSPSTSYTEVDCTKCGGLGIRPWGWLRADKEDTTPGEEA